MEENKIENSDVRLLEPPSANSISKNKPLSKLQLEIP
jgi:hypothetical protein